MGERCNRTAEASGSIPLSSTTLFPTFSSMLWLARSIRSCLLRLRGIALVSQMHVGVFSNRDPEGFGGFDKLLKVLGT